LRALVSNQTPAEYLKYLRSQHVQALVHGVDHVDMRAALEELGERFNVRTVRVDSGGTLIGVLLRAGLADEISLLVHPVIVGGASHSLLFAPDDGPADKTINARLDSVEQLDGGLLWLRYSLRDDADPTYERQLGEAHTTYGPMKQLQRPDAWPTWRKLLVTAGLSAAVIAGVLLSDPEAFLLFLLLGLATCALAGYWLGWPACFLVPLVAMGVEMVIGIPATLVQPGAETPISVVLEAPFWTGIPSLVGALVGAGLRTLVDRRRHSAAHHAA
jgi:hypothetical protein